MRKLIIAVVLLVRPSLGQEDLLCKVPGECFEGDFNDETLAASYTQCLIYCQDDRDCTFFTYYTDTTICITFSSCPEITDDDCNDCLTGEVDCPLDPTCNEPGECVDADFVGSTATEDADECLEECQDDRDCFWFEFDSSDNVCVLFENCPEIDDRDCDTCVVGERECEVVGGNGFEYLGKWLIGFTRFHTQHPV